MVLINYYCTLVHGKYESFQTLKNVLKCLAMAVSRCHFKAEVEARYQTSLCGTFGEQRTIRANFILCSSSSPVITVPTFMRYTLGTLSSPVSILPMFMPNTLSISSSPVSIIPMPKRYTLITSFSCQYRSKSRALYSQQFFFYCQYPTHTHTLH